MKRRGVICLGVAILVLALAAQAQAAPQAERRPLTTYLGIYGGYSLLPDTDVEAGGTTYNDQEFEDGHLVGGRVGWWHERAPWLAWEINVWNTWTSIEGQPVNTPLGGDVDVNLLNFSGSLLLQWLCGPVRLYGGGGPLGTWAELTDTAIDEDTLEIGVLGQAGLEYTLYQPIEWGLFAEYRFSWNDLDFEHDNPGTVKINDLGRHEFIGGASFRF